ncbi:integrin alpha-3-like [Gadus chalcogrammus]|uniref:integrin alpha-3-like n=1 Tax=Gadus chalcogrammus TaxID=1042646 RepID=UPI0024C3EBB5|nr:integrin alpha-3-like [Gadus chalcogrammus]
MLVGAPKEKAEPYVRANHTGGVYSCPITADQSDCSRITLLGSDTELDEAEDLIEDMWLGVSVASQKQPAGPILICGHRFVKLYGAYKLRHMIGKCYLRGNDLQQYHDSMHWQIPNQVCSHRGDVSGEVMCNMGISADISQTAVLVGAPGSYVWQGNVHVSWENPEILYNPEQSSFPNMDKRHTYIGYSVALATHLLSKEAVTIVTGAPRDDFRGSVFLADRRNRILVVNQSLHGEQMGSYYGNALAVTDLNNDGWSDLLVGAPFYFQPDQKQGGAVYVYMNQGGWLRLRRVLHGPWDSAFGMSLASAGDLNQDGYQDFAVGAPFFQTGSVYIWTGSSTGISQEPSQVIQGSQVSPGFRTFGFSLSGGLDVDHNFFPDLLVGSLDDTVALLRARTIVQLNQTLTVTPEVLDPASWDEGLQIKVCFSIVSRGIMKVKNITLNFTVIADITQHEPRLHFHENGHHVYSGVLTLATHPSYRCQDYTMGVVRPIQEHVSPVVLSLNASLVDPGLLLESPPHTHRKVHILKSCGSDHRCQSNLQMSAQFTNQELLPLRNHSGFQVFRYNSSNRRVFLVVKVTNCPSPRQLAEDAYLTTLNINIPPSLRYAGVRSKGVVCTDGGGLRCELGDPFISSQETEIVLLLETQDEYLDKRESHTHLQLTTYEAQIHTHKHLHLTTYYSHKHTQPHTHTCSSLHMKHTHKHTIISSTLACVSLNLLSDQTPVSVSLALLMEFILETNFFLSSQPISSQFGGHVTGESAVRRTRDISSPLIFTLQVDVIGKPLGPLGHLQLEVSWPLESTGGKWLLYLTEINLDGSPEHHCATPRNIVNPLNLTSEGVRKRSVDHEREENLNPTKKSYTLVTSNVCVCLCRNLTNAVHSEHTYISDKLLTSQQSLYAQRGVNERPLPKWQSTGGPFTFKFRAFSRPTISTFVIRSATIYRCRYSKDDCEDGSARCVVFTCRLPNMKTTSSLSLTANIWSPTLLEDYSDAQSVKVKGRATLKLQTEEPSAIRMSPQTLQLCVLLLPEVGGGRGGPPLWIFICSILTGLFLLSIICLVLRRWGFFMPKAEPWRGVSLHQGRLRMTEVGED